MHEDEDQSRDRDQTSEEYQEQALEMQRFIATYLRQLHRTGMPAPGPEARDEAPAYRVEARPEGEWSVIKVEPDGTEEESGVLNDRGMAYQLAGMFSALALDSEGMGEELAEAAFADAQRGDGPAQRDLIARILRGLVRDPAARELFLEGAGASSLEEIYGMDPEGSGEDGPVS